MPSAVRRVSTADGVSLEIPDGLSVAPQSEARPVSLLALAEPWPQAGVFRPNLTVDLSPLAPDRATVPQLSALTIAGQIAVGEHVAACDIWPVPTGEDGRRIISLYPAMDTTVVQLQYVSIRGGRAIAVSMQQGADRQPYGAVVFRHAVGTLRCAFDDPVPEPDPTTMPSLDPIAREQGMEVEDLSGIRAAQPFQSAGPPLEDDQLGAVRRGTTRGVDLAALQAGRLVTEDGRFTEAGEAAHRALSARPRAVREVTVEVVSDGDLRVAELNIHQLRDSTTLVASAPAGQPGSGHTLDVIASQTTPIALARWVGLAPAWTCGITDDESGTLALDQAVIDARLTDAASPAPEHVNAALERMWTQPWQLITLRAGAPRPRSLTVITTARSGSFRLQRDREAGAASLRPLPSAEYLTELLWFGGFGLADG